MKRLIIAMSGASGQIYGIRLLEVLKDAPEIETHLVMSQAASIDALASLTCPAAGTAVTGTSSLPVEMIPTTGFFATGTSAQPHAARTPASCGES